MFHPNNHPKSVLGSPYFDARPHVATHAIFIGLPQKVGVSGPLAKNIQAGHEVFLAQPDLPLVS